MLGGFAPLLVFSPVIKVSLSLPLCLCPDLCLYLLVSLEGGKKISYLSICLRDIGKRMKLKLCQISTSYSIRNSIKRVRCFTLCQIVQMMKLDSFSSQSSKRMRFSCIILVQLLPDLSALTSLSLSSHSLRRGSRHSIFARHVS
jgi:hypothetical protein